MNFRHLYYAREAMRRGSRITSFTGPGNAMPDAIERVLTGERALSRF
jgi:hypothetical protein